MRTMLLLALLLALPAGATEVYHWKDADGDHYSDQWHPGAEKIRIEQAPGNSAPRPAAGDSAAAAAPAGKPARPAKAAAKSGYESVEITSPAQQEVFWNIAGQVRVSMRVTPDLQPGHALRLLVDGTAQEVPEGSSDLQLQEVFRGVHTLKAQVVDKTGAVLVESQPTTFVVRQTSIARP